MSIGQASTAAGEHDAEGDDAEDECRHERHRPFAPPDEADERGDDPRRRRGDDREQAEPHEAGRSEVDEVVDDELGLERRPAGERRDAPREHDDDPDRRAGRPRRTFRTSAGGRSSDRGRRAGRAAGSAVKQGLVGASATKCKAGSRRTGRAGSGGRSGGRSASRGWRRGRRRSRSATATYGSIPPRSR